MASIINVGIAVVASARACIALIAIDDMDGTDIIVRLVLKATVNSGAF